MNVQTVEYIMSLITLFLAYLFSVTIAGFWRAWVTHKMGDDTAESLGLLTLNPIAHIDPMGLFFLFTFWFGWGKTVSINPLNIHGAYRGLKLAIAYFSDTVAYIVVSIAILIFLLAFFGPTIFKVIVPVLNQQAFCHSLIAQVYPQTSSMLISVGLIGIAVIYLNVMLAVVSFMISICRLFITLFLEKNPEYSKNANIWFIVIPMVFIIFFAMPLRPWIIRIIFYTGYFLARLLGLTK